MPVVSRVVTPPSFGAARSACQPSRKGSAADSSNCPTIQLYVFFISIGRFVAFQPQQGVSFWMREFQAEYPLVPVVRGRPA